MWGKFPNWGGGLTQTHFLMSTYQVIFGMPKSFWGAKTCFTKRGEVICWTARSMERSIFFFLKIHISAPGERNCPNFFFYGSFPIIFSCYKWVLSRLGPLHGQNWRNVSKKCLFGCPKPKSLKMTNLDRNCSGTLEQKIILFGFFHQGTGIVYWWKNQKNMFFCSRLPEQ